MSWHKARCIRGCYVHMRATRLCARMCTYTWSLVDVRGERTSVEDRESNVAKVHVEMFLFFAAVCAKSLRDRVSAFPCDSVAIGAPRPDVLLVMQLVKSVRHSILRLTSCLWREILGKKKQLAAARKIESLIGTFTRSTDSLPRAKYSACIRSRV